MAFDAFDFTDISSTPIGGSKAERYFFSRPLTDEESDIVFATNRYTEAERIASVKALRKAKAAEQRKATWERKRRCAFLASPTAADIIHARGMGISLA